MGEKRGRGEEGKGLALGRKKKKSLTSNFRLNRKMFSRPIPDVTE